MTPRPVYNIIDPSVFVVLCIVVAIMGIVIIKELITGLRQQNKYLRAQLAKVKAEDVQIDEPVNKTHVKKRNRTLSIKTKKLKNEKMILIKAVEKLTKAINTSLKQDKDISDIIADVKGQNQTLKQELEKTKAGEVATRLKSNIGEQINEIMRSE